MWAFPWPMESVWPRSLSALLEPDHFPSRGRKCLIYLSFREACFNCWLFMGRGVGRDPEGLFMEIYCPGGQLRIALHELLVLWRWWQMVLGRWFEPKDLMFPFAWPCSICLLLSSVENLWGCWPPFLWSSGYCFLYHPSFWNLPCLPPYISGVFLSTSAACWIWPCLHLCPSRPQERSLRERWDPEWTQGWIFLSGLLGAPSWTDLLCDVSLHLAAPKWPGEFLILTFGL